MYFKYVFQLLVFQLLHNTDTDTLLIDQLIVVYKHNTMSGDGWDFPGLTCTTDR